MENNNNSNDERWKMLLNEFNISQNIFITVIIIIIIFIITIIVDVDGKVLLCC